VAEWVLDLFCKFYSVKNYKTANTKAREKLSTDLEFLEFQKLFEAHLTNFNINQILLNKISYQFSSDNQAIYCGKHPY
jgi:hypothetical protein